MTKSRLLSFCMSHSGFHNPLLYDLLFSASFQMPFLQGGFSANEYYADAVVTSLSLVLYLLL